MLRHIIISDTHAPDIIQEIYQDIKHRVLPEYHPDAIVINGDLLGVFSMKKSSLHKKTSLTTTDKKRYLQLAAPNWHAKHGTPQVLTQEHVIEYVQERYAWVTKTLKQFSQLTHTYWNMGNHESPHHFLVCQELPFLLDTTTPYVPTHQLQEIFARHEQELAILALTNSFTYLRNKPVLQKNTLLLAIPGESHDATGTNPPAQAQKTQTKQLIKQATTLLPKATNLLIYNHTQGDYNKTTGTFQPASQEAKNFLTQLPPTLQNTVWIQSHNHWSYTQFLTQDNKNYYVLNNAGLHEGIYNLLEIDTDVHVYDIHTKTTAITPLTASNKEVNEKNTLELIKRNYPNHIDIYLHRKMRIQSQQPIRK